MIILLADSNALRKSGLEEYLAASRSHAIALSDWTLTEMRKRNALSTSRESLRLVDKFPDQCFALKRTDRLLDDQVRCLDDSAGLIDHQTTIDLRALAHAVRRVPPPLASLPTCDIWKAKPRSLLQGCIPKSRTGKSRWLER